MRKREMKAGIVLLADHPIQNFVRRIVFDLDQKYGIEISASHHPAHVSLKQPFAFESMDRLEGYFDSLAARIAPFPVEFSEIYYAQWEETGFLGLNVVETPILRGLHNQLNRELSGLFRDTSAPHDGDEYHFHLSIELGKVGAANPYRTYVDSRTDNKVRLAFQAKELGLFYSRTGEMGSYMVYKILPLTGQPRSGEFGMGVG
jgi:2'-5' RNA ligase